MMKLGFLGFFLLFIMVIFKCIWFYFLFQNCKIIVILQLFWGIFLVSYFQLLMSIMIFISFVYIFFIYNRLQIKNIYKFYSFFSSWFCYGEVFKEFRGFFILCGDFQMGIINIRFYILQYYIGIFQFVFKFFIFCLISLIICL